MSILGDVVGDWYGSLTQGAGEAGSWFGMDPNSRPAFGSAQEMYDYQRQMQNRQQDRDWYTSDRQQDRDWYLEDRDYQSAREDNAYQRKFADMKAAGINPLFAIGAGAGGASASTAPMSGSAGSGPTSAAKSQARVQKERGQQQQQALSSAMSVMKYFDNKEQTKKDNDRKDTSDSLNNALKLAQLAMFFA